MDETPPLDRPLAELLAWLDAIEAMPEDHGAVFIGKGLHIVRPKNAAQIVRDRLTR